MTQHENPKGPGGEKACAWCGGELPASRGTKPRAYCKDGCKQRAYEARRLEQQLNEAREAVRRDEAGKRADHLFNAYVKGRRDEDELRAAKSRDVGRSGIGKSRDDARSGEGKSRDVLPKQQVKPSDPPTPEGWGGRSPEEVAAQLRELTQRLSGTDRPEPESG